MTGRAVTLAATSAAFRTSLRGLGFAVAETPPCVPQAVELQLQGRDAFVREVVGNKQGRRPVGEIEYVLGHGAAGRQRSPGGSGSILRRCVLADLIRLRARRCALSGRRRRLPGLGSVEREHGLDELLVGAQRGEVAVEAVQSSEIILVVGHGSSPLVG